MKIRTIAVARINPAPYNPRIDLKPGDPEYEKLRRSIEEFGYVEPLVWNARTGHLVGGHQRFKVLRAQGKQSVDVSVVDLAPDKEKALNLALNRISGDWDPKKLAELLDELSNIEGFDLALTGFDAPEVDEIVAGLDAWDADKQEAFDVEAELTYTGPIVTKPGDLLELGAHRLLCGDCTDHAEVRRLIASGGGKRAALFATDPPYLVDYDGTNHPGRKASGTGHRASGGRGIGNRRKVGAGRQSAAGEKRSVSCGGNKDWSDSYGVTWDDADANSDLYDKFVGVAIAEAILPNAAWYCWHASKRQAMLESVWVKHGAFTHCQIVWVKNRPVLTRTMYAWQHEPCLMGWLKGNKPARVEPAVRSTVWSFDTIPNGPERPDHPTPKPLEIFEIPLQQHTRPGETCYEPFAGSGTQLIAAERLGRRCLALEISPRYCDLIVRRWIAFVGGSKAPRKLVERYRKNDSAPRAASSRAMPSARRRATGMVTR